MWHNKVKIPWEILGEELEAGGEGDHIAPTAMKN
jgi:hypothetical protein